MGYPDTVLTFDSFSHGSQIQYSFVGGRESFRNNYEVAEQMKMTKGWQLATPITAEYVGDYLISLAQVISGAEDAARSIAYFLTAGPSDEAIEFAASVKYKEPKQNKKGYWVGNQYYSMQFQRVSTVSSKQYDKRWERVADFHNGSFESVMRLVSPQPGEKFNHYVTAFRVMNWFRADSRRLRKANYPNYYAAQHVGWASNYEDYSAIDYGYRTCLKAIEIHRLRSEVKQLTDTYMQYATVKKLES